MASISFAFGVLLCERDESTAHPLCHLEFNICILQIKWTLKRLLASIARGQIDQSHIFD